jgi:hypothetical protein
MTPSETAKPAASIEANRLGKFEQLGGELKFHNNINPQEWQARRLCRLYALSFDAAVTLAPFVFAVVPR